MCHAHILQNFADGLVKVAASHRHQSSLKDLSVFLDMRTCKKLGSSSLLKTSNYLKTCSSSFPRAQGAPLLDSTLSSTQGVLQARCCSESCFTPCRGGWQVPNFSSHKESKCLVKKKKMLAEPCRVKGTQRGTITNRICCCELEIGTCHLPLHVLNHEPLQLPTLNCP